MNIYVDSEEETFMGTLMVSFVGISAVAGLIPLVYVFGWVIKQYCSG